MPVMKPVTICLARRSSWAMRSSVSGCRKRLGSSRVLATGESHLLDAACGVANSCYAASGDALRRENLLEALVLGQFAFLGRRVAQQSVDHLVGRDAFGRGREVGQD